MAAPAGKLEVDVEVKSSAERFWGIIRDSATIFPKAFPVDYKSIQILEGDGKAVGSVRLIEYGEGSPIVKISKERIEAVDEAKKLVTYSVIDGDLMKYFKKFQGNVSVTPKGDGSVAKWWCEYEKASNEIPDPHVIKDFVVKNFVEVDTFDLSKA
ncbi:hypothetical protein L6164_027226 [Bauhinia variegata]|uniref:Uncharacterized protein n=1 Tax=Bauhinia variegata TaxID=167791 RepID=A0ACB9LSR0_BAUVA|nr:hypothetical protein L6164_027226 [Bauhinia variegata]